MAKKTIVIVESPAKAKSISKFLGRNYKVKASMGHVRDLPKSQFGVDVEHDFNPKYITIRGKGDIIKELKAAVKKSDRVLLAADPDREGEAIAWHLQKILGIDEKTPCRIEFNEVTKSAVQRAVKQPRLIDQDLVNAQQARRILDRLVGYNLSPLLWRKVKKGLSAGRVQSVAVRMIVDREEEINVFVPEEYWSLTAKLNKPGQSTFEAKLNKHKNKKIEIKSKEQMDQVLNELKGKDFVVDAITRKEKYRHPAPPFTTSSLQQEAYRKLNFTARKTMVVAQQLYEGLEIGEEGHTGLVTYIRTDSKRVSETAMSEAKDLIAERFGPAYVPKKVKQAGEKGNKDNKVQDAHEAIRPTYVHLDPVSIKKYLTNDQYKLYKLIWSRFVASQMAPAVLDTTALDIKAGNYNFRANGSIIKFPGFMQVYIEEQDDEQKDEEGVLPELAQGEKLNLKDLIAKQHFTQPPPRYTDASLVKALEEQGIGRPSTYAPIVETIQKRGYVVRENKQLYPTELGVIIVDLLKNHFPDIINVEFTAEMEEKLDKIEEGGIDWVDVLRKFYTPFSETLKTAEEAIGKVEIEDEVTDEICDQCGKNLVIKFGRYGKFLACPGFPDCRFTKPLLEPTGVQCPRCQGDVVLRRSKKGRKFYGCSNYPKCDFVSWDQPVKEKCPQCNSYMVQKNARNKETYIKCSDNNCGYRINGNSVGEKSKEDKHVADLQTNQPLVEEAAVSPNSYSGGNN
ncbi:type I DNA topoisomerase [Desulfofalx alkaliphila]|uniref:type I DNA topoisomerase n=1 Tax=Desulfofalx alkaliphila TaxID=105483 RepID=UPI000B26D9DF|nr:type I DNA topoisomerase [Desulfofalx alkaliphila]